MLFVFINVCRCPTRFLYQWTSCRCTGTRRVPLRKQEQFTISEHLSSLPFLVEFVLHNVPFSVQCFA